jgi:Holliday junction resolvase-like predicted endonuclease
MPLESITWRKRQRMCRLAAQYLAHHRLEQVSCRFDVVGILRADVPRVEIVRDAFDLTI